MNLLIMCFVPKNIEIMCFIILYALDPAADWDHLAFVHLFHPDFGPNTLSTLRTTSV